MSDNSNVELVLKELDELVGHSKLNDELQTLEGFINKMQGEQEPAPSSHQSVQKTPPSTSPSTRSCNVLRNTRMKLIGSCRSSNQKDLNLYSEDERKSYRFMETTLHMTLHMNHSHFLK